MPFDDEADAVSEATAYTADVSDGSKVVRVPHLLSWLEWQVLQFSPFNLQRVLASLSCSFVCRPQSTNVDLIVTNSGQLVLRLIIIKGLIDWDDQ